MRRPVLIAAASLLAFPLMAQPRPDGGGRPPGPPIERIAQDLGLTDAQKASVQKIFEQQRAKREAARADFERSGTRPTPEQRQARMEQDRAEMRKSLATVLTPEQLDKLEATMRERRGPGGRGDFGRRGGDDEGRPEGSPPAP